MNATVEVISDIADDSDQPDAELISQWCQAALMGAAHLKSTVEDCEISVRMVDESKSAGLNSQYRQKDNATNVLSFPSDLPPSISAVLETYPLGDLVICNAVVKQEALAQHKQLNDHWAHLVIHGVLHLLGFDHQDDQDAEQMEALEVSILKSLNIDDPYEDRSISTP